MKVYMYTLLCIHVYMYAIYVYTNEMYVSPNASSNYLNTEPKSQ